MARGPAVCFAIALVLLVSSSSGLRRGPRGQRAVGAVTVNQTLVVTTILTAPFLTTRESTDVPLVGNDRFEGYIADLMKALADTIGIDYVLKPVADGMYGNQDEIGSWTGMIGELLRGEADIAAAPITITAARERVVEFTKPFMASGLTIVMQKPETTQGRSSFLRLLSPFPIEVWMLLCISYVVVSLLFCLLSRFLVRGREARSEETLRQVRSKQIGPQIADSFWWTLRSFLCQAWNGERWPTSIALRVLSGAWFTFTLLILILYVVTLSNDLPATSIVRRTLPVSSADDLAKQTAIQYGVTNGGSSQTFFRTSKVVAYEQMWAHMSKSSPSVFVNSTAEGIKRVRESDGKFAFIMESSTADYYKQRKPCDLVQVGGLLNSVGYGIASPIGSALRSTLSLAMLEMRETGTLAELHKKWWYDKGQCASEEKYESSKSDGPVQVPSMISLGLADLAAPFIILLAGIVLAILVAIVEAACCSKCRGQSTEAPGKKEEQQLKATEPDAV